MYLVVFVHRQRRAANQVEVHLVQERIGIPVVIVARKYQIHADLVVLQNEWARADRIVGPCLATRFDVVAI